MRRGFIGIDCPNCGRYSGKFHLGISEERLTSSCWRCGKQNVWKVLRAFNIPPEEIKQLLDNRIVLPSQVRPQGDLKLPKGLGPLMKPHIAHLKGRGLGKEQAELWGLQGIGRLGGRLAWRIFVPVVWKAQIVSWTTRGCSKDARRWIAARPEEERISSSQVLYGWDFVQGAAILCEGPGDCWAGGPGFVCPLGLKLSSAQIGLLASVPRRGICFDAEPKAQAKAREFADQLAGLPGETIICELERGDDPGSAPESELEELRQEILK